MSDTTKKHVELGHLSIVKEYVDNEDAATEGKIADAEAAAKAYADGLNAEMDSRMDNLEASVGGVNFATDEEVKTIFGLSST